VPNHLLVLYHVIFVKMVSIKILILLVQHVVQLVHQQLYAIKMIIHQTHKLL